MLEAANNKGAMNHFAEHMWNFFECLHIMAKFSFEYTIFIVRVSTVKNNESTIYMILNKITILIHFMILPYFCYTIINKYISLIESCNTQNTQNPTRNRMAADL